MYLFHTWMKRWLVVLGQIRRCYLLTHHNYLPRLGCQSIHKLPVWSCISLSHRLLLEQECFKVVMGIEVAFYGWEDTHGRQGPAVYHVYLCIWLCSCMYTDFIPYWLSYCYKCVKHAWISTEASGPLPCQRTVLSLQCWAPLGTSWRESFEVFGSAQAGVYKGKQHVRCECGRWCSVTAQPADAQREGAAPQQGGLCRETTPWNSNWLVHPVMYDA